MAELTEYRLQVLREAEPKFLIDYCLFGGLLRQYVTDRLENGFGPNYHPIVRRYHAMSVLIRILVAAEQLGHGTESVERIGLSLDYGSGPTFHKACHTMLGATPNEVRQRGGLRFACQRLCDEVRERRAAGAA